MKRILFLTLMMFSPLYGWAQQQPKPTATKPATSGNGKTSKPATVKPNTADNTRNAPKTNTPSSKPVRASKPTEKTVLAATKLIVTTSGAKVYFSPDPTSAQVGKLTFGLFVEAKSRSEQKKKVAGVEDYWYQVPYGNNKVGWIFGANVRTYSSENRDAVITEIMRPRMRSNAKTFAEEVEFYDFLAVAERETLNLDVKAELSLAHLVVLKRILKLIPMESREKQPYQSWLVGNEKYLVYSEPTQAYYLRFDLLWDLETQHRDLPFAERIAYEAAITDLAGECEGYLVCTIGRLNMREGRYLERYPTGVYVNDMMSKIENAITKILSNTAAYTVPEQDKKDLRTELGFLREAVEKIEKAQKETILIGLNSLEESFLK
ncbi:MAG: hypothetical protein J0L94_10215 [Rhodothermia bacterium]|nr:hypothetical protein [Rhodothermia bacterium]